MLDLIFDPIWHLSKRKVIFYHVTRHMFSWCFWILVCLEHELRATSRRSHAWRIIFIYHRVRWLLVRVKFKLIPLYIHVYHSVKIWNVTQLMNVHVQRRQLSMFLLLILMLELILFHQQDSKWNFHRIWTWIFLFTFCIFCLYFLAGFVFNLRMKWARADNIPNPASPTTAIEKIITFIAIQGHK